jgi:signal transduction histidine kinase
MDNKSNSKILRKSLTIVFGMLSSLGMILIFISAYSGLYSKGINYVWSKYLDEKVYIDALNAYDSYCMEYFWATENGENFFSHYYDEIYDKKNTNFRFTCISNDELSISGYYDKDEKKQYTAKYYFSNTYGDQEEVLDDIYYFNNLDDIESSETIENAKLRGEDVIIKKNADNGYYEVDIVRNKKSDNQLEMQVYVPLTLTAVDEYAVVYKSIIILYSLKNIIIAFTLIFFLIAIWNLFRLIMTAGRNEETSKIEEKLLDKIPFDIFTIMSAGLIFGCIYFAVWMIDELQNMFLIQSSGYLFGITYIAGLLFSIIVFEILILYYILSVSVRIKSRRLLSNTLIYKFFLFVVKNIKITIQAWQNIKAYIKVAIVALTLNVVLIFLIIFVRIFYFNGNSGIIIAMSVVWTLFALLISFEICLIYNIYLMENAINKIAEGQIDYKLEEKKLLKPFLRSVNAINHISDGLNEALKEQIKSEHFKTELITNVSHDIKTPLTSIMNYVGLLQKSSVTGDEAKEYLEVLERQSGKLKKLIEDMIEASKASTGNLTIDFEEIDAGMMVEQALAEYADRFNEKGLNVRYFMQAESPLVMADGKYLWRAFDNLLVNIYKYALENTRVYIDVEDFDSEKCSITFKNISKYEIKVTPEELTERFIRGDKSRNTEGSGLGLSIARGIIESMNGKMYIDIDGDLYKVVVILNKAALIEAATESE